MRIFISHSSKDKWAARRISDDLIKCGVETFLDEKDIKTGNSIDGSIKNHLKKCDDFLIIISPASLKSEWVLIELGGAMALEKNIIPILLYVGANEIPQIINLRLARDINEIGLYYNEINEKIKSKSTEPKTVERIIRKSQKSQKFKKGDRVKIISQRQPVAFKGDLMVDWEDEMEPYAGQETAIREPLFDGIYLLEIDRNGRGGGFLWAEEWLIPFMK